MQDICQVHHPLPPISLSKHLMHTALGTRNHTHLLAGQMFALVCAAAIALLSV